MEELVCADPQWSDLDPNSVGEITFAVGEAIYTTDPDTGDVRCVAHAGVDVHALDWNPAGERLLATTTWVAGYHPDGKAVVSAGVAADARRGLFLADNRGQELQQLAFFTGDDPPDSTITFVAVEASGNEIIFVHDHGSAGTAHLHSLAVSSIDVEKPLTTIELEAPPTRVEVSEADPFTFAWVQRESSSDSAIYTNIAGPETPLRPEQGAVFEIGGWLGQQRLVTLAHSTADPERSRIWLSGNGGFGQTLLADGVIAATTRTHHAPFVALDEAIIRQAVG